MDSSFRFLAVAAGALVVAACSTPVPQALKLKDVPPSFIGPLTPDASVWPNPGWWKAFGSDEMSGLIVTAQYALGHPAL